MSNRHYVDARLRFDIDVEKTRVWTEMYPAASSSLEGVAFATLDAHMPDTSGMYVLKLKAQLRMRRPTSGIGVNIGFMEMVLDVSPFADSTDLQLSASLLDLLVDKAVIKGSGIAMKDHPLYRETRAAMEAK